MSLKVFMYKLRRKTSNLRCQWQIFTKMKREHNFWLFHVLSPCRSPVVKPVDLNNQIIGSTGMITLFSPTRCCDTQVHMTVCPSFCSHTCLYVSYTNKNLEGKRIDSNFRISTFFHFGDYGMSQLSTDDMWCRTNPQSTKWKKLKSDKNQGRHVFHNRLTWVLRLTTQGWRRPHNFWKFEGRGQPRY